jgi:glycosyltransferase involved in cell wall biosynthesis
VLLVEGRAGRLSSPAIFDRVESQVLESDWINEHASTIGLFHLNIWQSEAKWVASLRRTHRPYLATLHTSMPVPFLEAAKKPWRVGSWWNAATWPSRVKRLRCPVVVISEWDRDRFARAAPHIRYEFISNGIPEPAKAPFAYPIAEAPRIAWIGAFSSRKRPALAVDTAEYLQDRTTLVLAGDGPERQRCITHAKRRGLGNVEFVGYIPDPSELLDRCACLLITSKWEGIPYVAGEAIARKRFIFATQCGGLNDLLSRAGVGMTCAAEPRAIADAISKFLRGPRIENTDRFEDASATYFCYDRFLAQTMRLYVRLLQES